jgi:hypothetical protein
MKQLENAIDRRDMTCSAIESGSQSETKAMRQTIVGASDPGKPAERARRSRNGKLNQVWAREPSSYGRSWQFL